MLLVVGAVTVHGNLVVRAVTVHVPIAALFAVHNPPNVPVVISRFPFTTSAVNDDAVHDDVVSAAKRLGGDAPTDVSSGSEQNELHEWLQYRCM